MSNDNEIAISVKDVHKTFRLPHEQHSGLKQHLINVLKGVKGYEDQVVLDGISFNIKKGEFFGIVGKNGSGKSTLLKLLAGIYTPTSGNVEINGSLTPFIELGVGFNPELTGRENVFMNGAMMGFSRKEMEAMYDDIVEFAEIERFMDQKLKNYSSGMQVRLAFSIAIRANTDILILDEVLAVGDAAFQRKCFDYFMSLKKNKRTVVLVTHDVGAVRQYCDRAIMIDEGKILTEGSPEEVAQAYQKFFSRTIENSSDKTSDEENKRWGTGKVSALAPKIKHDNQKVTLDCRFKANEAVDAPIFGFTVHGPAGNNILEGNTERENIKTAPMKKGQVFELSWEFPNIFVNGKYSVTVACCDESKTEFYDWFSEAGSFNINKETTTGGIINPALTVKVQGLTK